MSQKTITVVAAIILNNDQVLIAKRPQEKHKGGYWEFAGGKVNEGESFIDALKREIQEELAVSIDVSKEYLSLSYEYPEKTVQLHFYITHINAGTPKGNEGQEIKWVTLSELEDYQFPEANEPVLEKLISEKVIVDN